MISIIIPIYNAEKQLPSMIRCLHEQTFSDFEVLLVDDGSRDGSGAVCLEAAQQDLRMRYIHQENRGVSAARNLGLSRASGEFITFLDADDIVPENYLEILFDACRESDIAVCDVVSIQDDRELTRFTHPDALLTQTQALDFLLTRRRINSGPYAKLFHREVLQGLQFPPLKAYEDILFVREAFCNARRIAVTNRTEYRYIQNPAGAMSSFFKAPSADIVRATGALLEFIGTRPDLSPETFYITASHLLQYVIDSAAAGTGREFIAQARKLYRRFLPQLLDCPAFSYKEKIVYLLFVCGWLYADKRIKRVS